MGELTRALRRIKLIFTIKEVVEPNIWQKNPDCPNVLFDCYRIFKAVEKL